MTAHEDAVERVARARVPRMPKDGRLEARWGKVERGGKPSIVYNWGKWDGPAVGKATVHCLCTALEEAPILDGKCLREILIERGYDMASLRFTIDLTASPLPPSPVDGSETQNTDSKEVR